ncbi:MAG: recombinase family protein [Alistipes sp.]|nr:recombinase family protein [Alistipes sp.]
MVILRVGCYERVSTEEQVLRGGSVSAQVDNLVEHCEKNKYKIVEHYTDEGKSGSLPPLKRPALRRLLEDVEAGKIDMILFTKLDRWFRSVQEYFKVQEILDRHGVAWKAIHEDYDTTTANGRMAITIFLALAQNEREKTSERIKVVFEHKRKNGEACFGGSRPPLGYRKYRDEMGVMRLEKDPELEDAVEAFWHILKTEFNIKKAARHMLLVYGLNRTEKTWYRMAHSEFYCGMYGEIEDYCPPYVSREDWLLVQERTTSSRAPAGDRVYLFSGLIKCPKCGHNMCATFDVKHYKGGRKEYKMYRCRYKSTRRCEHGSTYAERKLEKHLIAHLDTYLADTIAKVELQQKRQKKKPKTDVTALKEQLRRLEVVYMAGNKSDEDYLREDKELKDLIAKAEAEGPPPERDLEPLRQLLETDLRGVYSTLDEAERKRFWQNIIKEIHLEPDTKAVRELIFF